MNTTHKKVERALWLSFAVLLIATLALQMIALLFEYDARENYFAIGAKLPIFSTLCAVLCGLCGIAAAFLTKGREQVIAPVDAPICNPVCCGLSAMGFLCAAALILIAGRSAFSLPTAIFLLLGFVYSILMLVRSVLSRSFSALPWLGMIAVIATIVMNAYYYFDSTVEMNAPVKVCMQISLLFFMLSLVSELRYLFDAAQPRMYLALHACLLASIALALPILLFVVLTGRLARLDYLAGGLLLLFLLPSAVLRILCMLFGAKTEPIQACEEPAAQNDLTDSDAETEPTDDTIDIDKEEN
ncbi:MAG: hypothetical protein IKB75_05130 [Clostridia bacterium]|nr:hypothetical protein [Clostridia bacterium]